MATAQKDGFKKAFLIGLGATALTVEKLQELANEMVVKGEMSQKEAKTFKDGLKTKMKEEKAMWEGKLKETVENALHTAIKSLGLVTKDDLKKELANLKADKSPKAATAAPAKKPAPKKAPAKKKPAAKPKTAKK